MTLDIKNVICVRIQPGNKGDEVVFVCSRSGVVLSEAFLTLKAGDTKICRVGNYPIGTGQVAV
jgi:hypothetical protein